MTRPTAPESEPRPSVFTGRFNSFLYRQHIRQLTAGELSLAREWSLRLIRREQPQWNDDQVETFYENLLYVRVTAVDEWTRRMT